MWVGSSRFFSACFYFCSEIENKRNRIARKQSRLLFFSSLKSNKCKAEVDLSRVGVISMEGGGRNGYVI